MTKAWWSDANIGKKGRNLSTWLEKALVTNDHTAQEQVSSSVIAWAVWAGHARSGGLGVSPVKLHMVKRLELSTHVLDEVKKMCTECEAGPSDMLVGEICLPLGFDGERTAVGRAERLERALLRLSREYGVIGVIGVHARQMRVDGRLVGPHIHFMCGPGHIEEAKTLLRGIFDGIEV